MYVIISSGNVVSICDKPRYVKQNDKGVYIETDAENAIAVAVCGELYNINGGDAVQGAPEAIITRRDVGEFVFRNKVKIEKNEAETGAAIIGIEDALCEMDAAESDNMAAIEDALCEIDSRTNGGE